MLVRRLTGTSFLKMSYRSGEGAAMRWRTELFICKVGRLIAPHPHDFFTLSVIVNRPHLFRREGTLVEGMILPEADSKEMKGDV